MNALLFLDVDGTLLPFGGNTFGGEGNFGDEGEDGNPLLAGLDRAHGPRLLALPCDLLWATTWMQDANIAIGPRLGLPELPVVEWSDRPEDVLHWKTRDLVTLAAGRTFVWVDDEIADVDKDWVASHHAGAALLYKVNPHTGLTAADLAAIAEWLRQRW